MTQERERARRLHDERGLVGKSLVVLMLLVALVGVAAVEAGSIIFTTLSLQSTADQVAADAARTYNTSHSFQAAELAAKQSLQQHDPDAKLVHQGITIDPRTGDVTVKLKKKASTLIVSRIDALKHFAVVTATSTAGPP
jgi:archaellin